jgi:hypothetical protein
MTDRELLELLLQKVTSMEQSMATKHDLARMEQDHGKKIDALFDGFTLRGDQSEQLQDHLDERLDAIQTDLSYMVSKVAQHDRNIVRLNKIAK